MCMYQPGDCVYPADLPRRFLCRVSGAESFSTSAGTSQILRLQPLEGPWPPGTILIRLDGAVVSAQARQLWQAHRSKRRSASRHAMVRVTPLTRTRRATA